MNSTILWVHFGLHVPHPIPSNTWGPWMSLDSIDFTLIRFSWTVGLKCKNNHISWYFIKLFNLWVTNKGVRMLWWAENFAYEWISSRSFNLPPLLWLVETRVSSTKVSSNCLNKLWAHLKMAFYLGVKDNKRLPIEWIRYKWVELTSVGVSNLNPFGTHFWNRSNKPKPCQTRVNSPRLNLSRLTRINVGQLV